MLNLNIVLLRESLFHGDPEITQNYLSLDQSIIITTAMPLFGPSSYKSTRDQKLAERQTAIDKASKLLSTLPVHPNEDTILATPAWELAEKIKSKDYSTLEVVTAFARRSIKTHDELNCLTEGSLPLT